MDTQVSRRTLLGVVLGVATGPTFAFSAKAAPTMTVHKDASCGCCEGWVDHVRKAGFATVVINEADMSVVKARLKVPDALASCHTAEIDGYVIEGHVPAVAIFKLLQDRPSAIGLAAPGMPDGSPGMETDGPKEVFDVLLFGANGVKSYGRFQGADWV